MSAEANEALLRRFMDGLDQGHLDVIDEVFAPECVWHMPRMVGLQPMTRDQYKAFAAGATGALTEMEHEVHDVITQGDKLVWRNTVRAKHTGDFMGSAPTGKPIAFGGIGIWRVSEGEVREMWVEADFLGLLQQVGAVPEAAAAS